MTVIGMTRLMYSENEILDMTPRKYYHLYDEYLQINGLKKKQQAAIDMLP